MSGRAPSLSIILTLHVSLFTLCHAAQEGFNDCLPAAVIHVPRTAVKALPATSSSVHGIANVGWGFLGGREGRGVPLLGKSESSLRQTMIYVPKVRGLSVHNFK